MKIIHAAAELTPIAKVGGLADVLHGLSRAQLKQGHDVEIILPKYDSLNLNLVKNLEIIESELPAYFDGRWHPNTVWRGFVDSIPVALIESHDPDGFFTRGSIYGQKDDISRFSYFCSAALEYIRKQTPQIVHLHDWHASLLALPLSEEGTKTVLTIHNLAYQGICTSQDLIKSGFKSEKMKEGNHYNILKGGIVFANHITTVSPNYAQEILTPEFGCGLQNVIKKHQDKLSGVLNGIDFTYWNPKTDPNLPTHYSETRLSGKEKVKSLLRQRLSLAEESSPIVSSIMRLVPQKGPELVKASILKTLEHGGQFVLLGSALDEKTHTQFYNIKRKLAGCSHIHIELTYNEELSHLVYAGSDLFLVPSLFEPCGLTQMIAMRYGTVPLVRRTGGLADTVFEGMNGFVFEEPTAEAIQAALDRALPIWNDDPKTWKNLMLAGMQSDFSWDKPAEQYLNIYNCLLR